MPGEQPVPLTLTTVPGGPDDGETLKDCGSAAATPRPAKLVTAITASAATAPSVPLRRAPAAARGLLGSAACCWLVMRPPRDTKTTVTSRSAHFAPRLSAWAIVSGPDAPHVFVASGR